MHGADCDCVRCGGFEPGNAIAMKHGAYSTVYLGKRAAQLAAEIRDTAPVYEDCDEPVVRSSSIKRPTIEVGHYGFRPAPRPPVAARLERTTM